MRPDLRWDHEISDLGSQMPKSQSERGTYARTFTTSLPRKRPHSHALESPTNPPWYSSPLPSNRPAYWRCDGGVQACFIVHSLGHVPLPWTHGHACPIRRRHRVGRVLYSWKETYWLKNDAFLHHRNIMISNYWWCREELIPKSSSFHNSPPHPQSSSSNSLDREKEDRSSTVGSSTGASPRCRRRPG